MCDSCNSFLLRSCSTVESNHQSEGTSARAGGKPAQVYLEEKQKFVCSELRGRGGLTLNHICPLLKFRILKT